MPICLRTFFLTLFHLSVFTLGGALAVYGQGEDEKEGPKRIQVLNSDVLEYVERDDEKVRKLIGNVALQQDSTLMFCDVAYQYEDSNKVDARGNVRVEMPDSVYLYADRMTYDGNTRIVELYDNILLEQDFNELRTDRLTYYRNERYGLYTEGGELQDTSNTLTSVRGWYYAKSKLAFFAVDVELLGEEYVMLTDSLNYDTNNEKATFVAPAWTVTTDRECMYTERGYLDSQNEIAFLYQGPPTFEDSTYYIEADTIYYIDSLNFGWAHCNLFARDADSTVNIYGDSAVFYRDSNYIQVTENPYLLHYMADDTLQLYADTLVARDDTARNERYMRAFYDAEVYMNQLQAIGDSLVYDRIDSIFSFYQDPVMWSDSSQITGDTIRVFIRNEEADSLTVLKNAFVISREEREYYNQVKGKNLYADIDSSQIRYIKVVGNAESQYFTRDDSVLSGMNYATSIDLEVFLKDNKPQRIRFLKSPKGTYYPMFEIYNKDNKLDGFSWRVDERPKDYGDLSQWTLDTLPPDSLAPDTLSPDTLSLDSVVTDSLTRDSLPPYAPDSLPPAQPDSVPDSLEIAAPDSLPAVVRDSIVASDTTFVIGQDSLPSGTDSVADDGSDRGAKLTREERKARRKQRRLERFRERMRRKDERRNRRARRRYERRAKQDRKYGEEFGRKLGDRSREDYFLQQE